MPVTEIAAPTLPLPATLEASLAKAVGSLPDLETLHGLQRAKLEVLKAIGDQLAALVAANATPRIVTFDPAAVTVLAKALAAELETHVGDLKRQVDALEQGLTTQKDEIQRAEGQTGAVAELLQRVDQAERDRLSTLHERIERIEREMRREQIDTVVLAGDADATNEELQIVRAAYEARLAAADLRQAELEESVKQINLRLKTLEKPRGRGGHVS